MVLLTVKSYELPSLFASTLTGTRQEYLNQRVWVANDDEKSFRSSDGHIKAFGVGQKAKATQQIVPWYSLIGAYLGIQTCFL